MYSIIMSDKVWAGNKHTYNDKNVIKTNLERVQQEHDLLFTIIGDSSNRKTIKKVPSGPRGY